MVEEWRDIAGYVGRYQISNMGNARAVTRREFLSDGRTRIRKGKLLQFNFCKGYRAVCLRGPNYSQKTFTIHRLVASTFIGQDERQIRHLDGNKLNNAVTNLAYGTAKENAADRDVHGTTKRGSQHYKSRYTEDDVVQMRDAAARGLGPAAIGRMFGINKSRAHEIITRKTWKHIP